MSTSNSDDKAADGPVLRQVYGVTLRPMLLLLGISYPYRGDVIVIESSRPPEEVLNDLSANIESFPVSFSVKGKYAGRVDGENFDIQWFEAFRRNGHIPVLYGKIEGTDAGSKIIAHFDLSPWCKGFMVFWWLASAAMCLAVEPHLAVLPFMIGAIILIQVGMAWGRSDQAKLLDLLHRIA